MNKTLMELESIFDKAMSYNDYLTLMEEEVRDKHLHYLEKMAMDPIQQDRLNAKALKGKLLVFCDTACPDCRIVTATLENMRKTHPELDMRLALREEHEEQMKELEKEAKIPMVIQLLDDDWRLVFYEIPSVLRAAADHQDEETRLQERTRFQRGEYKESVMEEVWQGMQL
jgi:uncharacterized protein YciI